MNRGLGVCCVAETLVAGGRRDRCDRDALGVQLLPGSSASLSPRASRRRPGDPVPPVDTHASGRPADQLHDWAEQRAPAIGNSGHRARGLRATPPGSPRSRTRSAISPGPRWRASGRWKAITAPTGARRCHPTATCSPPIRGVRLDGTGGNLRIVGDDDGSSDDGGLARAMGPMQFIPGDLAVVRRRRQQRRHRQPGQHRRCRARPRRAICAGAERISLHRGGGSPRCGPTTTPASTRAPCATGQPLTRRVTRYSRMNR